LLYGNNEGLKNEIIDNLKKNEEVFIYDEKEILDNENEFIDNMLSKSLFEEKKIIIIKRTTDKFVKIIEILREKKIEDIKLIVTSYNLEKRSKLRNLFENEKQFICVPFYPDNEQTLFKFAFDFFKKKNISISTQNINLIISKSSGERENLINELNKIEHYAKTEKKIAEEHIAKLTNLSENYSISELIDNCLAMNNKKIIHILNENNFSSEDCITIIRTLLNKSKRVLKLSYDYKNNNNIDLTISSAKPPIFWKEKEIVKQQIFKWKPDNIKKLIFKINEIELLIKKNLNNSVNLVTDFLIEQSSPKTNN
jgi:DNA polymerase-3 subunit delta